MNRAFGISLNDSSGNPQREETEPLGSRMKIWLTIESLRLNSRFFKGRSGRDPPFAPCRTTRPSCPDTS